MTHICFKPTLSSTVSRPHSFSLLALSAALFMTLSVPASASDFPDGGEYFKGILSDSGIQGPPYAQIVQSLTTLAAQYPALAQIGSYGKTVGGKDIAILKIEVKSSRMAAGVPRKAIYLGGSIHGDEYLNIEDRLPAWFLSQSQVSGSNVQKFLAQGGTVYIAPILNPDGYDRRQRENLNGIDLNRDYTVKTANVTGFKQPETRSLAGFLATEMQQGRQLKVAMDYHCCIGALLYPWSFSGPTLSPQDLQSHVMIAKVMQGSLGTSIKYGTTPVILGYSAKGTSKDFYYENFGALGFTFEGRRGVENQHFAEHTKMWDQIIASLL